MDLYRNESLCDHVKHDFVFAQNLYAALCNMRWKHEDEQDPERLWSCSWRYAGDVIATIREEGNYMDWYCSGSMDNDEGFVNEGVLVPMVIDALKEMGWTPVKWD